MFGGIIEVYVCFINAFTCESFDGISFAKMVGAGVDFDKSDFSRF